MKFHEKCFQPKGMRSPNGQPDPILRNEAEKQKYSSLWTYSQKIYFEYFIYNFS